MDMEIEAIYENIQDKNVNRITVGPRTQSQNRTEAQNSGRSRWFVLITVCLGFICVLLVIALILLYINLTAERDQMKMTYVNTVKEYNKTLNSLTDEKDQLQKNLNSMNQKKLDLENSYSRLTDERDQLEKNLNSVNQKKMDLENSYSRLTTEKDQLEENLNSINQKKLELETRVENLSDALKKNDSASHRYFISSEEKSWSDSRQFCRTCGGDLIIINTEEEQRYISSLVNERVWIGLSDIENEGNMTWVDNTTLNEGFWYEGEPNNYDGNEDCVEIWSPKPFMTNWNDLPCSEKRKWICEN